jgi:hypothetical protein
MQIYQKKLQIIFIWILAVYIQAFNMVVSKTDVTCNHTVILFWSKITI